MKKDTVRNTGFALLAELSEELSKGGEWLAAARTWMQSNIPRGDSITWGSTEPVKVTPRQLEELATKVALYVLFEERTRVKSIQEAEGQTPLREMRAEIQRGRELASQYIAAQGVSLEESTRVCDEVQRGGSWVAFGFNTMMSNQRYYNVKA